MNKYENIEFVDVEHQGEIVDDFVEDIQEDICSIALVTSKDLADFAVCEIFQHIAAINKIDFARDGLYVVFVDENFELSVLPLEDFSKFSEVDIAYIDTIAPVKQSTIDKFLDAESEVILFGYSDDDDAEEYCGDCKSYTHKSVVNGKKSLSLTHTPDGMYHYYLSSSTPLTTEEIIAMM